MSEEQTPQEPIEEGQQAGEEQEQQQPPAEEQRETPPETEAQKLQSWIGRRDKQIREDIQRQIEQNNQQILSAINNLKTQPVQQEEEVDIIENPDRAITNILNKREQQQKQYDQGVVNTINTMINNDPIFKDNEDMKKEVLAQAYAFNLDRSTNPLVNAQLRVSQAKSNVLSQRISQKTNPLQGNTPFTAPVGGISPSPKPSAKKPTMPKLTAAAQKLKDEWGYTDEQVAEILNKE